MNLFFRKRVDGIIACSISKKSVAHFLKSKRMLPLILADTYHLVEEVSSVAIDNSYGIQKVVDHLVQKGHKEIGFIGSFFVTSERLEAYKKSLCEYGIPLIKEYIAIGNERNEMGGYNRMKELLKLKIRPSAVIAETDNLAIGAMRSIRESGLRIPQDISIVGFDDITVSSFIDTPLTTMIQPKFEIGQKAAELLLEQLNEQQSPQVKHVILKPELIIRNSTI